jgi:hypothetical protein
MFMEKIIMKLVNFELRDICGNQRSVNQLFAWKLPFTVGCNQDFNPFYYLLIVTSLAATAETTIKS